MLQFQNLRLITKPSLMLILLTYFWSSSQNLLRLKYLIIAALFFSWFGDVFLLLDKQNPRLFLFGLGSFLVAHIFYIAYFNKIRKKNAVKDALKIIPSLVVLIYAAVLFTFLLPKLGKLQFPVALYSMILSAMLLTSLHAFDARTGESAKICLAGTIVFVFSDSLLAINRFYHPLPFAEIFIILSYAIAQLLITEGALRNLKVLENSPFSA